MIGLYERTISLGRNPRRGGNPPRERSRNAKAIFIDRGLFLDDDSSFAV